MISDRQFVEVVVILQRHNSLFITKDAGTGMKEAKRLMKLSQKGGGQLYLLTEGLWL